MLKSDRSVTAVCQCANELTFGSLFTMFYITYYIMTLPMRLL